MSAVVSNVVVLRRQERKAKTDEIRRKYGECTVCCEQVFGFTVWGNYQIAKMFLISVFYGYEMFQRYSSCQAIYSQGYTRN